MESGVKVSGIVGFEYKETTADNSPLEGCPTNASLTWGGVAEVERNIACIYTRKKSRGVFYTPTFFMPQESLRNYIITPLI